MNAYHVRGRYVYIILACMLTKTVCTQSLSSYAKRNYLSPLRNLRVMHLRISNFRYQYSHAVSTLPLYNTYTLCSCASYSLEHKKPPVYTTYLLSPRVLRFCYRPVIPIKLDSRRTGQWTSLPRLFPLLLPRIPGTSLDPLSSLTQPSPLNRKSNESKLDIH